MTPILIPRHLLAEVGRFFEDRGTHGLEGTAMIVGPDQPRLVIPDQHATRHPLGVSVEVTAHGQFQLATALAEGERFVARIHSHPGDAFHSAADDRNPVITFEGALSIVVPFFGLGLRRGMDVCAVYQRTRDEWRCVPPGPGRDQLLRTTTTQDLAERVATAPNAQHDWLRSRSDGADNDH